jgi:hypothetical protein
MERFMVDCYIDLEMKGASWGSEKEGIDEDMETIVQRSAFQS